MNKQETLEEAKLRAANYMSLKGALEPKQETLEEVAKRIYGSDASKDVEYYAFINGAKWQAEKLYSEEDMREAYFTAINSTAEGWNGEHAGNGSLSIEKAFNEGYEMFIEQYKNK